MISASEKQPGRSGCGGPFVYFCSHATGSDTQIQNNISNEISKKAEPQIHPTRRHFVLVEVRVSESVAMYGLMQETTA